MAVIARPRKGRGNPLGTLESSLMRGYGSEEGIATLRCAALAMTTFTWRSSHGVFTEHS
jgi:hypothetical protein